jgi:Flp pilus assembly protein TadG
LSNARGLARSQRGTAVVEFALVAPLLFLLVFGIIEFGRALNAYNQITQLAGQGARAAAVNRNPDGTQIAASTGTVDNADCGGHSYSIQCQLSKFYAKNDGLTNVSACITSTPPDGQHPFPGTVGAPLTVRVKYVYNFTTGLFGFAHITLSSTQTERAEATPSYTAGDQAGNKPTTPNSACVP